MMLVLVLDWGLFWVLTVGGLLGFAVVVCGDVGHVP